MGYKSIFKRGLVNSTQESPSLLRTLVYKYICVCVYREREREGGREMGEGGERKILFICINVHMVKMI